MTGDQLRSIRRELGLSVVQMARVLGYRGNDNSASVTLREYERDKTPIPDWVSDEALFLRAQFLEDHLGKFQPKAPAIKCDLKR